MSAAEMLASEAVAVVSYLPNYLMILPPVLLFHLITLFSFGADIRRQGVRFSVLRHPDLRRSLDVRRRQRRASDFLQV